MFDFDEDIYGRQLKVRFVHEIRKEEKFPNLDALKVAITNDIQEAKSFFDARAAV